MPDRVQISETIWHKFEGKFPSVATYSHVDTELLYHGDPDPFHILLAVSEIGRVSQNGLVYDKEFVMRIAEQLQDGVGGIRGHIPEGMEDSYYPIEEVYWIGHLLDDEGKLWAKGYVPPGATREFIRRKKAQGGKIGTSVYGTAVREMTNNGRWYARDFDLEQLDLAPIKRASLKMPGNFELLKEMEASESDMDEIRLEDVPQHVRNQIVAEVRKQLEAETNVQRVRELEQAVEQHEATIRELREHASIVAEIRAVIGQDADLVNMVREMHQQMSAMAEALGVPFAEVQVHVSELHTTVAEMRDQVFTNLLDSQIAELTNWAVRDEGGKKRVAAFRNTLRRSILAELNGSRDETTVKETVQKLWDEEFQTIGNALVRELAGPGALVPGSGNQPSSNPLNREGWEEEVLTRFNVN